MSCVGRAERRRPSGTSCPDGRGREPRLAAALAALPADQRVAVLLIDQFGYDYRAAAEALGVPVGAAASRVASIRARLRAALRADQEVG